MEVRKTETFLKWIDSLRDSNAKVRILARIERLACGNPGDVKTTQEGVSELRIDYGPGYRVYFKQQGTKLIILLAGGNKKTQSKDIEMAVYLARNL